LNDRLYVDLRGDAWTIDVQPSAEELLKLMRFFGMIQSKNGPVYYNYVKETRVKTKDGVVNYT
jgi:hypothetical protein